MPRQATNKTAAGSAPAAKTATKQARTKTRVTAQPEDDQSTGELFPEGHGSKKSRVPGFRLIARLKQRVAELGVSDRYIADIMGITPIYWNSLTNGHRKMNSLDKGKMERIAEFLEIPIVQVMVLADYLEPSDFFPGDMNAHLKAAYEKMKVDPSWAAWAPSAKEWESLSIPTRTGIVMLYETVYQKSLLRRAEVEDPELAEKMTKTKKTF
ncbi:helix-turn-helix transcriptional regulator [Noviherbaspirillum sp. CPCC 100848]|jgi:transcriptional regulator with XRE-family HTH domain|uniref:Helix-turn-helix transcriptional regulator n=1 Tax=Noviherbaspirillum album TaxID=3080276 RepID=A0ABU6JA64_9BURK|nr:helix-turn-helix transcriptional regulator [Noviherbaspirillum sp. CPCC 100848]MEC4720521.1 helix-turn-helix transcriptional regulator [Noviherbaspirillum sp. CPCC 100848]